MPELGESAYALMGTLELHGLVDRMESSGLEMASRTAYVVTTTGRAMLARLADEAPPS
jgi:hypothetical protein